MATDDLKPVYASGHREIDLNAREVRVNGAVVPLGGRAFDMIAVLVRAGGELVTKEELMAAVWPGTFVEENTIHVHISAFRKALGADRGLLRTTSGRGYRLMGNWTAKAETERPAPDLNPSPPAAPRVSSNLPVAGSDLIGRAAAVQHLKDLLSAYRAVTITGPGGIGKTRLALEAAREVAAAFAGDVWLIELAALVDPALVPSRVTASLGLEVRGNVVSAEAVARAVGERKLLLVLDNCEHVIDAAAQLADTLLRTCPGVTLLSTSRERLEIDGEYAYRAAPLTVPSFDSADVGHSSAVQLFLARTQALNIDVALQEDALEAIAAICRRLDGIPLAIEFAAARSATLGLEQVLSRLDDRFALLGGGRRTALPRHQTLRATLDWSYDLLSDGERRLLRHLSVFSGGFTLDGAASLGGGVADIVDGVASLVSKSLLDREGTISRWRLLETTRAYAFEKLVESGEANDVARRHAVFFRNLLAPDAVSIGRAPVSTGKLVDEREIDNVRAALDWAFSAEGDVEIGIGLTVGAVPLWVRLSLVDECRGWVERALAALGRDAAEVPRTRMQLSAALGWSLMFAVGRARQTSAAWSATLALAARLGDTGYRLRALWGLWVDDLNNGQFRKSADLAEEFAGLVAGSADVIDRMMANRMLATSLHYLGDQRNARHHIEIMLGHPEARAQDPQDMRFQFDQRVTAHYFQARIMWLQGFADQAMRVVEGNLEEARSVGNALSLASVLGQGACLIGLFTGDLVAAGRHGALLLGHSERHGLHLWQAWARAFNAAVMIRQGYVDDGLAVLRDELIQAAEVRFLPRYLVLIGELAAALGRAGDVALGLRTVDDAIARCEANEEQWYVAELRRIRGELVRQAGGADAAAMAEDHFLQALDCADGQGALAWSLRSAISLARLRRDQGRVAAAREVLSSIYGQFSEGFGTADLLAARQLLTELL